ncbi:MAG: hypothetical protein AB7Q97_07880 [Gammaproteobacteria bacterium]
MRASTLKCWLLAGALGCGGAAQAAVVGTVAFSEAYELPLSATATPSSALRLQFLYSIGPGGTSDIGTVVFEDFVFSEADAGRTVRLEGVADDPQFDAFVARATDGVDDDFRHDAIGVEGGGRGMIDLESQRIATPFPWPGPDLAGIDVTALELFIAEITINPLAGFSQQNWTVSGELRFIAAVVPEPVPLPAGLVPLAVALAALRRRRC